MQTVVGLYDRFEDAQRVVQALREAGFGSDHISMVARDAKGDYSRYLEGGEKQDVKDGAAAGAGIGAILGGLGGLLVGLGALAIPGIGPVLAAGPLVTTLAGAGVGAVAGGLVGALVDLGIPEEHAQMYAEGVRRGGTLVVVQTEDQMADQAAQVMNRFNPVDLNERSGNWGQRDQWASQELDYDQMEFNRDDEHMREFANEDESIPVTGDRDQMTIPLVEEDIEVGKREVERGGVRVQTFTREEPVQKDVNLRSERVSVERRPVDRPASDQDFEAFKEGTYEFKETGEEPMVQKTSRVVEEVNINKDVEEHTQTVEDTVRRQDIDVQPLTGRKWNDVSRDFQQNYQTTYGARGQGYEYYQPAYRMGYDLASNPQYRNYEWDRLEPIARQEWQRQRMQGRWEEIRDAVYYAWRRMRS